MHMCMHTNGQHVALNALSINTVGYDMYMHMCMRMCMHTNICVCVYVQAGVYAYVDAQRVCLIIYFQHCAALQKNCHE